MAETSELLTRGKQLLQDVALRYAAGHGLQPDKVEWIDQGYEWLLRISTEQHSIRVVFSTDEIEFFCEGGAEQNRETRLKIRNAFASLSM